MPDPPPKSHHPQATCNSSCCPTPALEDEIRPSLHLEQPRDSYYLTTSSSHPEISLPAQTKYLKDIMSSNGA
ncbi:Uncharacterized protein HZ326_29359, partial [Fusarium oxysporum f. sp. albedinis]